MNFVDVIKRWFETEWGGSLLLPDGWYGRPYDNQHALTSVEESDERLVIILDRKLILRFEGLKAVKTEKHTLVLGPFEKLSFDSESLNTDGKLVTKEYQTGEVRILTGSR